MSAAYVQPYGTPTVWLLDGRSTPDVSPLGAGAIYFDAATNRFKVSENGGAYVTLSGGGAENVVDTAEGVQVTRGSADTFGDIMSRSSLIFGQMSYTSHILGGGFGFGLLNSIGAAGTSADVRTVRGAKTTRTTTTALDNDAYVVENTSSLWADHNPYTAWHLSLETISSVRFFAGMVPFVTNSATVAALALSSSDPAQRQCGIAFDTSRGDTTFKWVESDGADQTITDTGIAPDPSAAYWVDVDISAIDSITLSLLPFDRSSVLSTRQVTSSPLQAGTSVAFMFGVRNLEAGGTRTIGHWSAVQAIRPW